MKAWFVFRVADITNIGVWANNYEEASLLMSKSAYKNDEYEFLGISLHDKIGPEIDIKLHLGMSLCDRVIESRMVDAFSGLRYLRNC